MRMSYEEQTKWGVNPEQLSQAAVEEDIRIKEVIRLATVKLDARREAAGPNEPVEYTRTVLRQCRKYTDVYNFTSTRVISNEEVIQAMRDDGLEPDEYTVTIMDTPKARVVV